jgi:hypothetical protein
MRYSIIWWLSLDYFLIYKNTIIELIDTNFHFYYIDGLIFVDGNHEFTHWMDFFSLSIGHMHYIHRSVMSVMHLTIILMRWCWMMNQMRIMSLQGNTIIIVGLHIIQVNNCQTQQVPIEKIRYMKWKGKKVILNQGWIRHSTMGFGWRYELHLFKC